MTNPKKPYDHTQIEQIPKPKMGKDVLNGIWIFLAVGAVVIGAMILIIKFKSPY